jgi:protein TonB
VVMNGVPAPAAPAMASEGPKQPVRVGGNVKPPRLLSGPAPIYPILAKQSRIQGMVIIEAIIDEKGNVIEMHAISGHPLLIPAAMKAVSQRKYEPTILDGEATPVNLRVEITFHAN